jgi:hypothetical protein
MKKDMNKIQKNINSKIPPLKKRVGCFILLNPPLKKGVGGFSSVFFPSVTTDIAEMVNDY